MPIYFYWGDDDFAIAQATKALQAGVVVPEWASFNVDKILPDQPDALQQALNQAMTPPFGTGGRFVWVVNTPICQRCPEEQLRELERSLPVLPNTTTLVFTATTKPDNRLKSSKLVQKIAEVKEFSQVDSWKTEVIAKNVRQTAQQLGVALTADAVDRLAAAIGNDTRRLHAELEKLRLYAGAPGRSLTETDVDRLVTTTTQSSFKLAAAIRQGQTGEALDMVTELLQQNEPALQIVASLVKQFRTWTWIKLMLEAGERDDHAIAQAAEIGNPKRLYFLKPEVQSISSQVFLQTLPLLLELESSLKRGAPDLLTLQTKVVELCELCGKNL